MRINWNLFLFFNNFSLDSGLFCRGSWCFWLWSGVGCGLGFGEGGVRGVVG